MLLHKDPLTSQNPKEDTGLTFSGVYVQLGSTVVTTFKNPTILGRIKVLQGKQ